MTPWWRWRLALGWSVLMAASLLGTDPGGAWWFCVGFYFSFVTQNYWAEAVNHDLDHPEGAEE